MPLPALVAVAGLGAVAVPIVVKVLVALGVGFVTYTGVTAVLGAARTYLEERFSQLPTEMLGFLALLNVDIFITMVFSAYTAKLVMSGVSSSGVLRKFAVKGLAGA